MNKIIIGFIIITISFNLFSQTSIVKEKKMSIVKVEAAFLNELDSVISFEKQCPYFNDSLFFMISVHPQKDDWLNIKIESTNDYGLFFLNAANQCFYYNNLLFVIKEEDHTALIKDYPNMFTKKCFFTKTKMKKLFSFKFYEEANRMFENDDSHTMWIFKINNSCEIFDKKYFSLCDKEP